jgi:hypothetical protein
MTAEVGSPRGTRKEARCQAAVFGRQSSHKGVSGWQFAVRARNNLQTLQKFVWSCVLVFSRNRLRTFVVSHARPDLMELFVDSV